MTSAQRIDALAATDERHGRRRQRPPARGRAPNASARPRSSSPDCTASRSPARTPPSITTRSTRVAPVIARLARDAERELAWCPGVLLEDKTYALTCHVRLAPPELADRRLEEFEALAEPQLEARRAQVPDRARRRSSCSPPSTGTRAARPSGSARGSSRGSTRPVSIVYLGDDRTDEDAFTCAGRRRRRDRRRRAAAHAPHRLATGGPGVGGPVLRARWP